ncbi:MAG: holo-ACP synthase [Candidatus Omnitrophica bacterium]|nr:holo-ACP synthase [Candidatus Omnitrophota bacterium]
MEIRQGIDITNVRRVERVMKRRGSRFLHRVFTQAERDYCESKRMKAEHYASRFAAKEAAMKAFEVKREHRYRFREIEVRRRPTGKPFIYLSEESRKRFGVPKRCQIELSMSHERDYAIATVFMMIPQ